MPGYPSVNVRLLHGLLALGLVLGPGLVPAFAQPIEFVDETATRLVSDPELGVEDTEEKDYAWGDVDKDGDIDLVVVRKEPFTSAGKRRNVLFLNEGGVLVDRTAQYVVEGMPGDQGFLTPTNDRDVQLADFDGDGWLDIVTAVTISDGDPKHIGHPRIYFNQRRDAATQEWKGFSHAEGAIPEMVARSGEPGFNPRFCAVAVGDVDGDDKPDLWFSDYDTGEVGPVQPEGADFDDRLLINQGRGFFIDDTARRLNGRIAIGEELFEFRHSAFGAAAAIADMNGDGVNDIIKQTSLESPLYVGVAYNEPDDEGYFDTYQVAALQSPYFFSIGDLNNDGLLDIVITDDGVDRYLLNQGNDAQGMATFVGFGFAFQDTSDDGFGGNSVIADLNNDGWNDVLIADVDVDTPGCDRRMHIYRNLGGMPGGEVVLQEQTTGERCPSPGCLIAGIPRDQLTGVHDVAVFDIDQDGWNDLVVGRCSGTQIYMGQEPTGLVFTYPQGLPFFVPPGETYVFQVQLTVFGPVTPVPGTVKLFVSIGGGATEEVPLVDLGDDRFEAQLPAAACGAGIEFYVEGEASNGEIFRDPPSAPSDRYRAVGALGKVISWEDDLESGTDGWTVVNDPSLTAGGWEAAAPNGTLTGFGEQAAPDGDAQAAEGQVIAFVTDNGPPGGAVGDHDVDGGPTDLISPPINLAGSDGTISYSRWFFTASVSNTLTVWVTANGTDWELVETVTGGSHNQWEVASFRVSDYVTPSSAVQVRFRTADNPNSSITEAGVDLMRLERLICNDCTEAADCDDGLFCTGAEDCVAGTCVTGSDPCPGQACDEALDVCVGCNVDQDCDDGIYCNGLEACVDRQCEPGGDPCPGETCDEALDTCLECVVDADCDDGAFCNGAEQCLAGSCRPGGEACPGRSCDEEVDACLGTVALQPRMGQPLLGLTPDELDRFERGRTAFDSPLTAERGLGPIFNQNSCGSCHNTPLGGSGSTTVTRFGFVDDKAGGFNPLESLGGSLRQSQAIAPECAEIVPAQANITAERVTSSVLGAGLIEAIPDDQILSLQSAGPGVSGRAHQVAALEAPETMRVGRFGWKAQVASLLTFSADAAVNEMGLTNRLLPDENAPNGDAELLGVCDTVPDPEDVTDSDGFDFIDRVTDFQRFLAAPPQTPRSGMSGEQVFVDVGCAGCHVSTFVTAADEAVPAALRGKTVRPYSDFLLHDMGQSADFIEHGQALQREIRTPALWGVRVRDPLWHDGRFVGGLFADRVMAAIDAHDALGSEAAAAAQSLAARPEDHPALIAFLDSLGRAEFDHDGDGDVDFQDYDELVVCFSGPGVFYGPDDPCSVSDPDQDGDVDEDDLELFRQTVLAPAGGVPNGADRAGNALVLERSPSEQLELTWGGSCSAQDDDFAVYTGPLGDFADPQPLSCGTGGFTRAIVAAPPESSYFLVVPLNAFREGSYGTDSEGRERAPSTAACLPQTTGACF